METRYLRSHLGSSTELTIQTKLYSGVQKHVPVGNFVTNVTYCGARERRAKIYFGMTEQANTERKVGAQLSLQECKGFRWMPRLQEAMKDVIWLR